MPALDKPAHVHARVVQRAPILFPRQWRPAAGEASSDLAESVTIPMLTPQHTDLNPRRKAVA
jgi:hypothetical protein